MFVFLLGGVPIYLFYYKKAFTEKIIRLLSPFAAILKHGYFFYDVYEKIIAQSIVEISKGLRFVEVTVFENLPNLFVDRVLGFARSIQKYVEIAIFEQLPQLVANGVIGLAHATHKYFVILVDKSLNVIVHKTVILASKIQKTQSSSLQRYIAAAVIGFILILILIVFTILR
jgi:hypothetical protein